MPLIIKRLRSKLLLEPNNGRVLYKLGCAYAQRREFGWSVAFLCQAVAAEQKNPLYYIALGRALLETGRYLEAVCAFRQALAMDNSLAAAYDGMGMAQNAVGEVDFAKACLQLATKKDPANSEFWTHLATILNGRQEYSEAQASAMQSYRLNRKSEMVYINLVESSFGRGQLNTGLKWMRKGLRQNPKLANGYHNMARGFLAKHQCHRAIEHYHKAIACCPQHGDAHFGLSNAFLALGNFTKGWDEYEWRLKLESYTKSFAGNFIQDLTEPMWAGEDLKQKTLLVYGEQGFGDTIQSVRFVSELVRRGARIILMVYKELVPLLKSMTGVSQVIAYGDLIPRYDYHIPVFSLPKILKIDLETIPRGTAYIATTNHRKMPAILSKPAKLRVGLFWSTKRLSSVDYRSMRLQNLEPLLRNSSVNYFSFQMNEAAGELKDFSELANLFSLKPFINDWQDTASLISKMDLLVSIDSGIVHLAGALGKPVWVMLPHSSEWRWLAVKKSSPWFYKSPWYPTMRLFRSTSNSSWIEVIRQVENEIALFAQNKTAVARHADAFAYPVRDILKSRGLSMNSMALRK